MMLCAFIYLLLVHSHYLLAFLKFIDFKIGPSAQMTYELTIMNWHLFFAKLNFTRTDV